MIQTSSKITNQLTKFASRLQDNPEYMAFVISQYQRQERLNDFQLMQFLGSNEEVLPRLLLCKRPSINSANFSEQVHNIAEYVNINTSKLAQIIRQVDFIKRLSEYPETEQDRVAKYSPTPTLQGLVTAARDRGEDFSQEVSAQDENEPPSASTDEE